MPKRCRTYAHADDQGVGNYAHADGGGGGNYARSNDYGDKTGNHRADPGADPDSPDDVDDPCANHHAKVMRTARPRVLINQLGQ